MELLVMWGTTVVASIAMEVGLAFQMFKDVADQGYKIDLEKYLESSKQLNSGATNLSKYSYFIPVVNLLTTLQRTMSYSSNRPFIGTGYRLYRTTYKRRRGKV